MSNYAEQERAKWWPVSPELMAQYKDGTHTEEDAYWLNWQNHEHQYHRDGDLPAIICKDGTLEWWQNDLYHRYGDRPAFIGRDGHLAWFQNNHYHRLHGPAVILTDGRLQWWWRGKRIPVNSQEEFVQYLTLHNLTEGETMKPKTITARDAYAIYEEAIEKRNLMLAKLWEETYAPKLDKLIRERAELGCNFVYLEYDTWGPMKNFIEGLGYKVREYADTLSVSWSKG